MKSHGVTYWIANPKDAHVRKFLAQHMDAGRLPDTTAVIAFEDQRGVIGGWAIERYTGPGGTVHAHWAGRDGRWLKRTMLEIVAGYIFIQLGCNQVLGEVAGRNHHARRVCEKLGFSKLTTIPAYFPDDMLVIYRMTRSDCRWIPTRKDQTHGQQEFSAAGP